MSPKVSFVVAIYNVAQYIEQCVRSLYEQKLENIEIVLVDDCSPDNSLEIALRVLDEYPHRKPQVKVVRHEKNLMNGRSPENICTLITSCAEKSQTEFMSDLAKDMYIRKTNGKSEEVAKQAALNQVNLDQKNQYINVSL